MNRNRSQKEYLHRLVMAGILTAIAMILSWIEAILPFSLGIPGVKLGLCHIITLIALYRLAPWEALALTTVRVCLIAMLFGNAASLIYSAVGGFSSLAVMLILKRVGCRKAHSDSKPLFSMFGVSIAGAVTHNLAQFSVAALLMQTMGILSYLPVLILVGIMSGALIGAVSASVITRMPKV